jgi:exopolysaccharide production protein ExoY
VLGEGPARILTDFLPGSAVSGAQLAVAIATSLFFFGAYRSGDHWRDPIKILTSVGLAVVLALYSDLWHGAPPVVLARGAVIWMLVGFALVLTRSVISAAARKVPRRGLDHRVLEIRGSGAPGGPTILGNGFRTLAVHRAEDLPPEMESIRPWLNGGVDTILVAGELPANRFGALTDFALAHGCRLLTVPRTSDVMGVEPRRVWLEGKPFYELTAPSLRASQAVVKRLLDVGVALALLATLAPLFGLVALWILLDSPGPVIFRQLRPGYGGRLFGVFKFRTMRADAEQKLRADPELYKRFIKNGCKLPESDDPRITRPGRFLRKTSLDELPQLINVLRGDMSLVGPRPLVGPELDHYADRAVALLSVKPGMTGLWQVSGRSRVGYPERADIDMDYVRSWSLLRDLWILAMTVPAVLLQRGAQ